MQLFDLQLKELEKNIKKHIESDPLVRDKVNNILKIKGCGILTIATVLAETNGFDVVESQSGSRIGNTRISKKGNPRIRRALHMPSLVIMQCKEKPFYDLFVRTYAKHGIKMKSYVAVQKKLLTMIYYFWKKNEMFNPEYQSNIQEVEQEFLSREFVFEEEKLIKNSLNIKVGATQGKHPVNYRKKLPLGKTKVEKILI